jgi:hypothetical protein
MKQKGDPDFRSFNMGVELGRCDTLENRFSKNLVSNFGSLSEKIASHPPADRNF